MTIGAQTLPVDEGMRDRAWRSRRSETEHVRDHRRRSHFDEET